MSTKIYNGCIIKKKSPLELMELINKLRIDAHKVLDNILIDRAAELITELIDYYLILTQNEFEDKFYKGSSEKENYSKRPFWYAHDVIRCETRNAKQSSDRLSEHWDFSFSLVLFPFKKNYLCIPYSFQHEFEKLWKSQSWKEEYGYWDNTDAPEGMSYLSFKKRGMVWETVFKPHPSDSLLNWKPSMTGITAEIISKVDLNSNCTKLIIERIKPISERAESVARCKWKDNKFKELLEKNKDKESETPSIKVEVGWEIYNEVLKLSKAEDVELEIKAMAIEIEKQLRPITVEMIIHDINKIKK